MLTKSWFLIASFLIVALVGGVQRASQGQLDDALIKSLFGARLLDEIRWERGSFTTTKALEALVAFHDRNQCHACGWREIWLLRFAARWEVVRKLADSGSVSFKIIDIDQDGKSEIWITHSDGNQGAFNHYGELLSLDPSGSLTLYSMEGFDNFGAMVEGEAVHLHEIEFRDLDGDGILEILEAETRRFYQWTGERFGSDSDYVEIAATSQLRVLKLEGGSFQAVDVP